MEKSDTHIIPLEGKLNGTTFAGKAEGGHFPEERMFKTTFDKAADLFISAEENEGRFLWVSSSLNHPYFMAVQYIGKAIEDHFYEP